MSSSSSSSIHHTNPNNTNGSRAPVQGALPVNLNCCNDNQSNSADSEDWSWYKRHSVSVMDHRRIAALRESRTLDGGEQFSVGLYDVPPNNASVLDSLRNVSGSEPVYDFPRPNPIAATPSVDHEHYKKISQAKEFGSLYHAECQIMKTDQNQSVQLNNLNKKESVSPEMNVKKEGIEEISHEASLQRLKKQESDLQREMVLLDELLQNCATKSQDLASQSFDSACKSRKTNQFQHNHSQIDPEPLDQSVLAALDNDFTIISGNIAPVKPKIHDDNHEHANRNSGLRLNTSLPDCTPISPLFHAKLNNIPSASRWNRPLPYVNLSKYDDESYSHVHLPGSADCVPPNLQNVSARGLLGQKAQSSSLSSLPVATVKNWNRSYTRELQGAALQMPMRSYQSGQYPHRKMNTVEEQEVLIVDLNDQSSAPVETEYASIQSPTTIENKNNPVLRNSDIINILTSDAKNNHQVYHKDFKEEVVYENIPALRESPPPPQLPPKGPALLKKLQSDSKTSDYPGKSLNSCFVDAPSESMQCNKQLSGQEEDDEKKSDPKEGNYLMMGSPKLQYKHLPSSDHSSIAISGLMKQPSRKEKKSLVCKGDYLDMASGGADSFHEDEIYLDGSRINISKQDELYISEADLMLPPRGSICKSPAESAYMDMSTVALRKTSLAQRGETSSSWISSCVDTYKFLQDASKSPAPLPPSEPPPLPKARQIYYDALPSTGLNETHCKSPTRVYVKVKNTLSHDQSTSSSQEPPKPFPNLIDFSKKMSNSKSTYINTTLDSDQNLVPLETYASKEVLLPEPVKEGFLARFKRRSSKEKSFSPTAEKPGNGKQRNSVLERSMSEHESSKSAKEEKISKLKAGRRRSSSFPNRLSYQESVEGSFEGSEAEISNASAIKGGSSSSSRGEIPFVEQCASLSSVHDPSSESDVSPLMRRNKKPVPETQYATVMLVSSSCTSGNPFNQNLSLSYGKPSKQDSSKTDDEKLIERMQGNSSAKKPIIYQRSSSLELKKMNKSADHVQYLKVPKSSFAKERRRSFEKLFGIGFRNSSSSSIHKLSAQDISLPLSVVSTTFKSSRNDMNSQPASNVQSSEPESPYCTMSEDLAPSLPPKTKAYQSMLTPVNETAPTGFPPQPEPIYVEMDEVVSHFERNRNRQINQIHDLPPEPYQQPEGGSLNRGTLAKDRQSEKKAGIFKDSLHQSVY